MLLTVGMLAGRTWQTRLGYSAIAFGVWDIFYYVFLKVIYDWPKSLFDWDILFLLPLPWWGPVLAPMSVAVADDRVGHARHAASASELSPPPSRRNVASWLRSASCWRCTCSWPTRFTSRIRVPTPREMLPDAFNWSVFVVALTLMAAPVAQMTWRRRPGPRQLT